MNRRTFTQALTAAALGRQPPRRFRQRCSTPPHIKAPPFPLSVMLWTVFNDLPFEQRLAKVAEAGYTKVELVGEYRDWTACRLRPRQCRPQAPRHQLRRHRRPDSTASPIPSHAMPFSPSFTRRSCPWKPSPARP